MESDRLSRISRTLAVFFVIYTLAGIPMADFYASNLVMPWNLFLAAVPLFFAARLKDNLEHSRRAGFMSLLWTALWLLFFPNSPYMLTDFIHIIDDQLFDGGETALYLSANPDLAVWLKLVHIALGVLAGTLAGLLSLYIVHRLLISKKGTVLSAFAVAAICVLSGFAVYIGRFLRLNTWDILNPIKVFSRLSENLSLFALQFSLLFALYVLASYLIFYFFYHRK